ncbi:hypothetical protein FXO37_12732 [Capsicum annuum]|nr:hypothetical protein FXO37_12732 [Capsicum annuum]
MSSSMLTPTHKYAAGALFGLALHQAQIHQTCPLGFPDPSPAEERSSSCSSNDSVSDDPQLWAHQSSDLLRPIFKSAPKKAAGVLEVDQFTALSAQLVALQNQITNQFSTDTCAVNEDSVNYVGNANSQRQQNYGNTYNPNWRNHPNFSWGGNQAQSNNQYKGPVQQNQQQVQNNQATTQTSNLEEMMKQLLASHTQLAADMKNQQLITKNLELQIGQIAGVQNTRPQGGLPSDTKANPK